MSSLPEGRHAMNLSGATRIAFAAFHEQALQQKWSCFLLDVKKRSLVWLDQGAQRLQLRPVIKSVGEYLRLADCDFDRDTANQKLAQAMKLREAAMACWQYKEHMTIWSKSLRDQARNPGVPFHSGPRRIKGLEFSAVLKKPKDGNKGTLHIGDRSFSIAPWPRLAAFICGEWYRDAILANLVILQNQGHIQDLAVGVDAVPVDGPPKSQVPHFDILFTDGIDLTMVNCNLQWSGYTHIKRLVREVRRLGGEWGHGILSTAFERKGKTDKIPAGRYVTPLFGTATVSHPESYIPG
jgi:hypothetical protein